MTNDDANRVTRRNVLKTSAAVGAAATGAAAFTGGAAAQDGPQITSVTDNTNIQQLGGDRLQVAGNLLAVVANVDAPINVQDVDVNLLNIQTGDIIVSDVNILNVVLQNNTLIITVRDVLSDITVNVDDIALQVCLLSDCEIAQ